MRKLLTTVLTLCFLNQNIAYASTLTLETANDEIKEEQYLDNEESVPIEDGIDTKFNNNGIPLVEITTKDNGTITKESYIQGEIIITDSYENVQSLSMKIKGRGNSTWIGEKKPYRIKLDSKSSILGMEAEKDWVLLANHYDKTLVRNKLAFDLANEIGVKYTPDSRFVDVVLNGEYLGNYLLCEQVEISKNSRVTIPELTSEESDENNITGGYLLEINARLDEETNWTTNMMKVPISFKNPEVPNDVQYNYITNYIDEFEKAINSDNFSYNGKHYSEYIDVDSFINFYIVQEVMKNKDAQSFSSIYLYKDRNGKLGMGPVWDFDLSGGNSDDNECKDPSNWYIRQGQWYSCLFKDPIFAQKVEERFKEVEGTLRSLNSKIDSISNSIEESRIKNFERWKIIGTNSLWPHVNNYTYEGEINYLKNFLNDRVSWIYNNFELIEDPEEPVQPEKPVQPEEPVEQEVELFRIIGSDRYQTATMLSESKIEKSETVIIVNGGAIADGLSVTALATYMKAPILLVGNDNIPEETVKEIQRLGATKAIIAGGTGVVSESVTNQLRNIGISNVERLAGVNRYLTSFEIAKYIDNNCYSISNIVIANGLGEADAMSISSVSGRDRMPVLLVEKDKINNEMYDWLKSKELQNAYIIGGDGVVSEGVLSRINSITKEDISNNRLGGKDRYDTNARVIDRFFDGYVDSMYLAKGLTLVDGLTSGVTAALDGVPVILMDNNLSYEQEQVLQPMSTVRITQVGGGILEDGIQRLLEIVK
ncbi:CotH kinase family protein [Clostridium sp. NSJ-145]|uniref:CotH kinase family protein n=1 Tax=Clostridium sp. NSJ-145 TaxID=2897777 RepID=UPI001E3E4360|nr:CotH kinase family protein [Clostridium sp. NSJ-145]MCD2502346.1 CotH kinase family protein [Clostridium sp. NSJ-145]